MKQPVWILNSSLLVLFFMSQLLLFMLQKAVPRRIAISPGALVVTESNTNEPIDLLAIYENDLFGTYQAPAAAVTIVDNTVAGIPQAPKNIVSEAPVEKAPAFFAPLDGVLKGIIFVKDDPASSLAIIQFKKTKEEENYQVGDLIEDAQVLKILPNRIIIIRSNGQQETLYLREEDAIHDFNSETTYMPKNVIESSLDNKFRINMNEFVNRIPNLGAFINLLDLTTAYRQGKSYGCRIGAISKDSLGGMLGFLVDDIIVKIDDFYVDDLSSRINIYDHILSRQAGDVIEVTVDRSGETVTLLYGLTDDQSKDLIFTKKDVYKQLTDKIATQKNSQLDQDSVVIQSQSLLNRASLNDNDDDQAVSNQKFDDSVSRYIAQQQVVSKQDISSPVVMPIINQQTLNQADMHTKRLMQERDKLSSAVQSVKIQDREKMLKQTNRNVIFNGMAQ